MSAEAAVEDELADQAQRCRWPNCWRDGVAVAIAGKTEQVAVLCDEHRRVFLGVSS